ncbi:MAG TPA: glycosyltransferase, partial [Solirubrobacteraceae bacterium]|nr:glycosyltransferase [Solirubrobacteraceae bacterium]
ALHAQLQQTFDDPRVTVMANPRERGLSHARNAGVERCLTPFVAFVDDDAIPDPGWLAGLRAALGGDGVVAAGGHARPRWVQERPAWLADELLWTVGCSYAGMVREGPARNPLGCNMAFRAEVFARVGGFDPTVGRLGSKPLGCEETELCLRTVRDRPEAGIVIVEGAEVEHLVTPERCRRRYVLQRCFYEGISKALVRLLADSAALDTERGYLTRALPAATVCALRAVPREGASAAVRAVLVPAAVAAAACGYVLGRATFAVRPPRTAAPRIVPGSASGAQAPVSSAP